MGTTPSTELTMLHDILDSQDGALLTPESSTGTDGNQQHAPSEDHEVTLLLKPVPEHALEQNHQQILGPYSEKPLFAPTEEQSSAADTEGSETVPEPNPAVRLALFRNNENKHPPVKPPRKIQPAKVSYFEGREEEFVHSVTTETEKLQRSHERTYEWLHTQVGDYEAISLRNVKCNRFLPDLDPDILNGGRVQLVASPVSREDTDLDLISMISGSALTQNREKNNQPHRHSAGSSTKDICASERTRLSPFRKERISFRDHPVQLSGGWGSGKKKAKTGKH